MRSSLQLLLLSSCISVHALLLQPTVRAQQRCAAHVEMMAYGTPPAKLRSDKISLVGELPPRSEFTQYLGIYKISPFAPSRLTLPWVQGKTFYEQVADPNKMIWWDGTMWVVGNKNGVGKRIGMVCVDERLQRNPSMMELHLLLDARLDPVTGGPAGQDGIPATMQQDALRPSDRVSRGFPDVSNVGTGVLPAQGPNPLTNFMLQNGLSPKDVLKELADML